MKKIAVGILAAAIIATTTITGMAGYGKGQGNTVAGNNGECTADTLTKQEYVLTESVLSRLTANKKYVDSNGNGICDNYENGSCNEGVCDGTGAGAQRNGNAGAGQPVSQMTTGKNYTDANADGICDNCERGSCNGGVCDGTGAGTQGNRHGQSNGGGCHGGRNR